jgi:eukaryotic-like serine/threonine-protein kinase
MTELDTPGARYALLEELGHGGMATIHRGVMLGEMGFHRSVAIKRLRPGLAEEPDFVAMLCDEARIAGAIQYANVVQMLDVVISDDEVMLVMDLVRGESLDRLTKAAARLGKRVPHGVACACVVGVLRGLHAAHEAKNVLGQPLGIVHRDVSPQNILIGTDGIPRLIDFGVAKSNDPLHQTDRGQVNGKLRYLAPEQLSHQPLDRRVDVFAAGIVLWELLTGKRLYGNSAVELALQQILHNDVEAPSRVAPDVPEALDAVVLRALARDRSERYQTAREFATDLERALRPAEPSEVAEWLASVRSADSSSASVPHPPASESCTRFASLLGLVEPPTLRRPLGQAATPTRWRMTIVAAALTAAVAALAVARARISSLAQDPDPPTAVAESRPSVVLPARQPFIVDVSKVEDVASTPSPAQHATGAPLDAAPPRGRSMVRRPRAPASVPFRTRIDVVDPWTSRD